MKNLFILFTMIYLHILDDFHLQGILAKMKQREWWMNQATGNLYRQEKFVEKYGNDYIVALLAHSFSWAFIISLPLLIIQSYLRLIILICVNTLIHAFVDNLKTNKLKINLIQDQSIHLILIIVTWLICII